MDVPKVVFFDDCTAVKVDITAVIRILNLGLAKDLVVTTFVSPNASQNKEDLC